MFGHDSGATIAAILGTAGDVAALEGDVGTPGQSSRVQAVVALAPGVDRTQAVNPLGTSPKTTRRRSSCTERRTPWCRRSRVRRLSPR